LLSVLVLIAAAPHAMAANWADSRVVGPFVCQSDFPLEGVRATLDGLTRLHGDLVRFLGIPPVREPIDLYLFHDKASYSRYVSHYLPTVPYRRALFVKNRGPGCVFAYWSRELDVDLRHECTHALLHASLRVVPLWLDEGLAGYFEVAAPQRAFNNVKLDSLQRDMPLCGVTKLENLEKKDGLAEMGRAEYRDSWAWVHFMLHGPAAAGDELTSFLADIRHGNPPGVLSTRLRRRIPDLERQVAMHFSTWTR
jgi:hypothetical protein